MKRTRFIFPTNSILHTEWIIIQEVSTMFNYQLEILDISFANTQYRVSHVFRDYMEFRNAFPDAIEDLTYNAPLVGGVHYVEIFKGVKQEHKHQWKERVLFSSIEEYCTTCPEIRNKKI